MVYSNIENYLKANLDCSLRIVYDPYFKIWEASIVDEDDELVLIADEPIVFTTHEVMEDAMTKLDNILVSGEIQ